MTWLGIDVGTTNLKAGLISADGATVLVRSVPTPADVPALQAVAVRLIAGIVRDQSGAAGVDRVDPVDGVGIAGMAETGAALGQDLRPLTELIGWREQPGGVQAERLARELGAAELFARTGLRLSPKLPVVTWRWLRDTTDVLARTRTWAGAPDLVLAALTGTCATHLTHAQRLGVLALTRREWDPDLLAYGGITARQLPPVAEPMTVAGRVTNAETGLRTGTPVVLCGHDHLVGAWAAGVREPGQVADSLGTSEAIVTPSPAPVLDDALRRDGISSSWYVDGRHGCAVSGNGAAGGLIEQRLFSLRRDYAWLAGVLAESGPPSDEVIAPYPAGRQAPAPDPAVRYDPTRPVRDPAAEMRALVDAVSLQARWMAETQTALLGIRWQSTIAFGGPARLGGWMARKALADAGSEQRGFAVVAGEATAAVGAAVMAAEVLTGRPQPVLRSSGVPVDGDLAASWDRHFWERFHKVTGPAATRGVR